MTARATKSSSMELLTEQDIVRTRQEVRKLTQELQFSLVDQTKMVTAASELARNAVLHGGGGKVLVDVVSDGTRSGLRLTFIDHGPGIANLGLAMTEGWTSGHGLGLGLTGAKRLCNEFSIDSEPGRGTTVMIARWK